MKKRGFTLIELLAVIVVLAIIALIATPIVMNVIKNASAGAAERSADNYIKAVDTLIATNQLDGTPLADGQYTVDSTGKLTKDGNSYEVEVSGTKPVGGTITIANGQVVKDSSTIDYTDYTVTFKDGVAEANEKGSTLALCTAIAPVAQSIVDLEKGDGSLIDTVVGVQATEAAPYATGAVYQCNLGDGDRIFYVLKVEGDMVSLLMEENIGTTVTWCASGSDNSCNGDGAIAYLNSQTSGWTKLVAKDGRVNLPSAADIDAVVGQTWNRANLDGQSQSTYGYWTGTAGNYEETARVVESTGTTTNGGVSNNTLFGVRPVITISKADMSL